jgi:3-hydroxyisobutyrate dehydrogenase-like beta-hydroxyacid dehydrogenase
MERMAREEEQIGLIGAGLMGAAIAQRLLGAGFRLLAWDRDAERLAACRAEAAVDADMVARCCERILLSLPDSPVVEGVIAEMMPSLRRGTVLIDTTTGAPGDAERFAADLRELGVVYLEAAISGSSEQVRRGEALCLVGGDEAARERCSDVFAALGGPVMVAGGVGNAARLKLVTNLVLGLNRAALAEGLALAESMGLDAEQTAATLKASAAYSRIMDSKAQKMIRREFSPVARLSQHLKDVELMLRAGEAGGMKLPLTETHRRILLAAVAAGLGNLDNSAIVEVLRRDGT